MNISHTLLFFPFSVWHTGTFEWIYDMNSTYYYTCAALLLFQHRKLSSLYDRKSLSALWCWPRKCAVQNMGTKLRTNSIVFWRTDYLCRLWWKIFQVESYIVLLWLTMKFWFLKFYKWGFIIFWLQVEITLEPRKETILLNVCMFVSIKLITLLHFIFAGMRMHSPPGINSCDRKPYFGCSSNVMTSAVTHPYTNYEKCPIWCWRYKTS